MPELRKDPISDRWVIIASERGKRPHDFKEGGAGAVTKAEGCPFCGGNEAKTPPEVSAWREKGTEPNKAGWSVRVVENKFPALQSEGEVHRSGTGIFDQITGIGRHEVIIETPNHGENLAEMKEDQIAKILWAYKHRLTEMEKDERLRYILVFKNYGKLAGASLEHAHSQIIATPITPRYIKLELSTSREYFHEKERCIFCDLLRQEIGDGTRIVTENEHFITFTPFASRFPFELWILPRHHQHNFSLITDKEREQLAKLMKETMMRLKKTLNDPPYNYVLHTSPNPTPRPGRPDYWGTVAYDFHWHIEVIPRLTKMAGFEWGTGLYINPTSPEEAAKFLREVEI
ncbi:galactose-1-phosphate uridylyltransferase [Candidatus Margulisiibacteriota bacterium]